MIKKTGKLVGVKKLNSNNVVYVDWLKWAEYSTTIRYTMLYQRGDTAVYLECGKK